MSEHTVLFIFDISIHTYLFCYFTGNVSYVETLPPTDTLASLPAILAGSFGGPTTQRKKTFPLAWTVKILVS